MAGRIAALVITSWLAGAPAWAQRSQEVDLRCRMADGPWQPCVLLMNPDGMGWQLRIGGERIRFHHNGTGLVSIERPGVAPQVVEARWLPDASLCWNGICAQGAIPLD